MSNSNEQLRPGMSLAEVTAAIRDTAVFRVEYIDAMHGDGYYFGQPVHDGQGEMSGVTTTEPPLAWSIYARSGVHGFGTGYVASAQDLAARRNDLSADTFTLSELPE